MDDVHLLENYYPGDGPWKSFVGVWRDDWSACTFKEQLLYVLSGKEDLAIVIYGLCGNGSLRWVNENVPALDGITPLQCLLSIEFLKRLRTCLMRFPV